MKRIRSPERFFAKAGRKTEDGFNGINYVFYLMVVLLVWIIFACATFLDGARVAENACDIGLHEIESGALALNGKLANLGGGYDAKLKRVHIIPAVGTSGEGAQVAAVGSYIESEFKKKFVLVGSKAEGGILKQTCEDADVNLTKVVIYEPIMPITISIGDTTLLATGSEFSAQVLAAIAAWQADGDMTSIHQWPTLEQYLAEHPTAEPVVTYGAITQWIGYELHFDANNHYTTYTKKTYTTANPPKIQRDPSLGLAGNTEKVCEGATIEMTMSITVYGVRRIFADSAAGTNSGVFDHVDPMFANNPTKQAHTITITQAADIVPADSDSRKR